MEWVVLIGALACFMFGVGMGYVMAMRGRTMYNAYVARTKMMKEIAQEVIRSNDT